MDKEPELRKLVLPEVIFGIGALELAGRYLSHFGARKALVVTDPGVMEAGWTSRVLKSVEQEGIPYAVYHRVTPNPREEDVMAGAEMFRSQGCNIILAVGGGSPMDCAKGIGIVSSNERHILEFEGVDMVSIPSPPLICIPTTAGTSADVSQFAIITDSKKQVKIAIISKAVVPDVALIDPAATTTMDATLTAHTGLDAFVHAVEAFVSNASSPLTDLHALEAVGLIARNLLPVISDLRNMELREQMMLASLHAGIAFSNASLGAVHAMAHSLGGLLDTPHGETNSILLKHVMEFNYDWAAERYDRIGRAMGLCLGPEGNRGKVIEGVAGLCKSAGVNHSLKDLGVKRENISELAKNALNDACMVTNPRPPEQEELESVYEKAL